MSALVERSDQAASTWTRGDQGVWKRELHSMALRVDDLDHNARLQLPWSWRVLRVVNPLTEIEVDAGRAATCERAMTEAEAAAGIWR